jgi:trans-aconitate 2-methyltransferase
LAEPEYAFARSPGSADEWDSALYLQFEAERTQPARDLLARLDGQPRRIVDLGCGPGTSTRLIAERFPSAEVVGVDNSAAMLVEARRRLPHARFEHANIVDWAQDEAPDVIFANDSMQWLPDHEQLFARLIDGLAPGGALAVQMPDTRHEPSHALMRMIAVDGPWADRLAPIAKTHTVIATYIDYLGWLKPYCFEVDIWQTTYLHLMRGVDPIVDWFRGAALRPFLRPLRPEEQAQFIERFKRELADAYETDRDGALLFLYPRLFIRARKAMA